MAKKNSKDGILRKFFGVVFLFFVAAAGVGYWKMGSIVKAAIENVGPRLTGTAVHTTVVLVSPLSGRGTIKGFRVGNPAGYSTDEAFKVGSTSIDLSVRSLLTSKIVIHKLYLSDIELNYEGHGAENNLSRLQANIERNTRALRGGAASATAKGEKSREYVIEDFWIQGVKVKASQVLPMMGNKTLELELPEIRLKNVSNHSGAQVAEEISRRVGAAVQAAVVKLVQGQLQDKAKQVLENAKKQGIEKGLQQFKGLFKH